MASLSVLSIEVLECITGMVITSQQMRLWQCGDRILNIKLKNGGLKRTSLSWSHASWMPWPRRYFRTFSGIEDVKWDVSIGKSLCPSLEFHLLPKTLKRLHLACDDVFVLLRLQSVKMNDLLPLLQSLRLKGSRLREENLRNLPSNLIELHVTSSGDNIKSSTIFGDLPRSLQILAFSFMIVDESEHENDLPSELISVDINNLTCNFNWFAKLPKSLKMLKMTASYFDPDWQTLPPQLEELKLFVWFFAIPKSAYSQLPQSLKTLVLWRIQGVIAHDDIMTLLSKNLSSLKLSQRLNHSELKHVPVSLTDLDTDVPVTHPDILSFYPANTIRIRLADMTHAEKLNLHPFPTKLQYLTLSYINDDICTMLPPGLRELNVGSGTITTKGASKLPKSLESLSAYFDTFDNNETMSFIGYIANIEFWSNDGAPPSGVNENWLSSLLPSSSQKSSNQHYLYYRDNENGLNSHLNSLTLHGDFATSNCPFVKESFFSLLPKFVNLNTLEISRFSGISCAWLCLVPQNVTDLYIHSLTAFPTATQLSKLPKCLRYLDLQVRAEEFIVCDWKDEVLQSLPRSLQEFRINGPFSHLTPGMYEYLPPNLQTTSLASDFRTPLLRLYGE